MQHQLPLLSLPINNTSTPPSLLHHHLRRLRHHRRRHMADTVLIPTYFMLIFIMSTLVESNMVPPTKLLCADIGDRLRCDREAIELASTDYGHMVRDPPAAVLHPSSVHDIAALIKSSYESSLSFTAAARGHGHSVRGQAMARGGVVIDMAALKSHRNGSGVEVRRDPVSGSFYADVGGELLWIEVLHATLKHGLSPVSWTDYLYLTVGGTLSNAGISGQTFRYGPQISNVYEMDVVTGKGEIKTCSSQENSELFYGVLGGLGQFGVISRARIVLDVAPKRVKWVRMLYNDFSSFTRDQEHLILNNAVVDYLEGSLLMSQAHDPSNWRSSFFPSSDYSTIISLVSEHGIIYCLEIAMFYHETKHIITDKELELLQGLGYIPGFVYEKDVSYVDFLDRVRSEELKLQSQGLWEVPHPWLILFVPKSRISEFNSGVFENIVLKNKITTGPVLVYPMLRNRWDNRMSAVIPEDDDDVFYTVGFLHSSGYDDHEAFDDQNRDVMEFCENAGIKVKQYIPHYSTKQEWMNHFGTKWTTFQARKDLFDPKMILSPGHRIFRNM